MKNWQEANHALAETYGIPVPDYDLTPVLQLISAIDPEELSDTITEMIIAFVASIMTGARKPSRRSQEIMANLKLMYRTFEKIHFDEEKFCQHQEKMIMEGGIFSDGESQFLYPNLD